MSSAPTPMLRIRDLNKRYGSLQALRDLELDIEAGELFGFLGPNGAGKTTTLQIVAGLLEATAGSVEIAGYDLTRQPREAKLRLGYVPDRPYLYDKLTGRELLELISDLYGLPPDRAREQGGHWLETFSMTEKADDLIGSYSHGMKQRVVLAATFLTDPELLLLDEPMVGLDPRAARLLKNLLREHCRRGRAVVMSTHSLADVEETCDRVGIIDRGRLVAIGAIEELREQSQRAGSSLEEIFLSLTAGPGAGAP